MAESGHEVDGRIVAGMGPGGRPPRSRAHVLGRSVMWAAGWGIGAALGVATGAYLTATSGAGAPGVAALDTSDLVRMPALAGGFVFAAALVIYIVRFAADGRTQVRGDEESDHGDAEDGRVSSTE